ncbi:alpha/beta hydrolase [Pontiella sulfatireligans]|uniref:S-formylglutathione hydrolase FrmB n=1 Tax=Pontiella sulfatireligans TaxID=2750658 RepID=A0A6C2UR95_9BACT|nr:alpha/beta hydrolase family protein [Pontiella sulfatireligans]VGO22842.1 S-formylglutathione hydrolase FrmB [Pontiella sulfatireligans]
MALIESRFDSQVLDLSLGANIILPEHPNAWNEPPAVLYLLHGLSDDHTIWSRRTSIERYARDYNLVIVMPDAYKSFYCDMKHGSNYLAFMADELPMLIKRWLNVSSNPKNTFVAGLSMGGYGAVKLALGRPGQYAAAASLSGALDIASHINDDWNESRLRTFEAVFGSLNHVPNSSNDLIAQIKGLDTIPETKFYACCGTEDYLYQDSVAFRGTAAAKGLHLTYEESAGEHEWGFWDNYIQRVLEWLPIERLETDSAT